MFKGMLLNKNKEQDAKKLILQVMESTSNYYHFNKASTLFYFMMKSIQDSLRDTNKNNRAKMTHLQILWDRQVEKYIVYYSSKAKKKEFP